MLEVSWVDVLSFGGVLGSLLGSLGEVKRVCGEIFGGSWGILGGQGSTFVVLRQLGPGSGAQGLPKRDPTWHPKCDPKRTKIEDKNEDENKTFFKIVLKRSWSHLGPILGPSDLQNRALA